MEKITNCLKFLSLKSLKRFKKKRRKRRIERKGYWRKKCEISS
jgi:hypothetical protein